MAPVARVISGFTAVVLIAFLLSGCASMSSLKLLEKEDSAQATGKLVDPAVLSRGNGNLVAPPPENLQMALPPKPGEDVEEMDLGPDVPTLNQLDQAELPGINTPRTATELESDIVAKKVSGAIQWRGQMSGDGIDITNVRGVLCTGATARLQGTITLACSDGRVGRLQIAEGTAKIHFGKEAEGVDLARSQR